MIDCTPGRAACCAADADSTCWMYPVPTSRTGQGFARPENDVPSGV